jgi:hypothetical protein
MRSGLALNLSFRDNSPCPRAGPSSYLADDQGLAPSVFHWPVVGPGADRTFSDLQIFLTLPAGGASLPDGASRFL